MFLILIVSFAGICIPILTFFIIRSLLIPIKYEKIENVLQDNKIAEAIQLTKKILLKNKNDYIARFLLAKAYIAENKDDLALIELKFIAQTTNIDNKHFEIEYRQTLSSLFLKMEKIDEALQQYLLLVKIHPKNADFFFQTGKLLEKKASYKQAALYYQQAITIDRYHANAHSGLGILFLNFKHFDDAKKEFDTAILIEPENYAHYYYLGRIYKEQKNYSDALVAFETALNCVDLQQKTLIERGLCFIEMNDIEKAIFEFDLAAKSTENQLQRETLFAQYFLASCYEKNNQLEQAVEQWNSIYKKDARFQDVAEKIAQYKYLQVIGLMKDFLSFSGEYFVQFCMETIQKALDLITKKVELTNYGCKIIAIESEADLIYGKQKKYLILFARQKNQVPESILQQQLEQMQQEDCFRTIVYSASGFTDESISFVKNKPIELKNQTDLEQLFSKAENLL